MVNSCCFSFLLLLAAVHHHDSRFKPHTRSSEAFDKQPPGHTFSSRGNDNDFVWPGDLPRSISLRKVHGRLNASWKISCLAVNGQSFLVIDGYLLNPSSRMMDH